MKNSFARDREVVSDLEFSACIKCLQAVNRFLSVHDSRHPFSLLQIDRKYQHPLGRAKPYHVEQLAQERMAADSV